MYSICIAPYFHKVKYLINTDDKNLYNLLFALYKPFVTETAGGEDGKQSYELSFYRKGDKYIYTQDDEESFIDHENSLYIIENLFYNTTVIEEDVLAIHSAVVAVDGKAFIMAGATGTGKSTLCAYLNKNGFDYLSDDLAMIKKETIELFAYPRPLQLRQGGLEVLNGCGISTEDFCEVSFFDFKRYIVPTGLPLYEKYSLEGIYFLKRRSENILKQASKKEAFINVMKNQFVSGEADVKLFNLFKSICNKGAYFLTYSDMDFVKETLLDRIYG